jgi:PAS domain S-box-containing protein
MTVRIFTRLRRQRPVPGIPDSRKRFESELRDCREMLEETQQIARIGSWAFDVARRRVHWSSEVSRILEIGRPAVAAHEVFLRRVHREDRVRVAAAYSEAARHGSLQAIDYRLQFPDGRIKDVRERRVVRCGADGRVLGVSGTVQDITESKLAEAMLESEKSRLRTFLNTIPDLVWIKDTEGTYLACNPVFEKFFGAKEAEIVGKSDFDFVDAELATHFREKDKEAMEAGRSCVNEEWVRFAHDGRRALLETIKTPFHDDQQNIAGVLGIARDITERKRMEEQLHLREQDFRTISENSPDPIARYDAECRCVYMNPALLKLLGKKAASPLGKTPLEASRNLEVLRPYEEKIREALRTGQETELELISDAIGNAGRPVCDHIRFTPEFDCEGSVVSVLAVGRDIAGLKKVEQQLSRSGAMLRTLVARQEKDREAERKRIAWEVHEELGQLLAALRFDLSLMQDLREDDGPPAQRPSQSAIHLLDRAFRTVRSLTSSLRPRVLDLGIDAALEWLADEFTRHTAIPCSLHCREPVVLNEEQVIVLFRVTQEALDNIARHAEAKSVEIIIDHRDNDYILTVRDDGKGFVRDIPKEGKLGLLLIHERVRTAGGNVVIDSTPGHGTRLDVCIPALLAAAD